MPLPAGYNYSPSQQPSAWWSYAQQQIPGLPALPQGMSGQNLAQQWEAMGPNRSALSNLYQQSMGNPNVGQQTQEGAAPAAIPTEAGNSALSELVASMAGASRVSTTPLEGLPGSIGATNYSYSTPPPQSSGQVASTPSPYALKPWPAGWPMPGGYGPPPGSQFVIPDAYKDVPGSSASLAAAAAAPGSAPPHDPSVTNPQGPTIPPDTYSAEPTSPSPGPGYVWNGYGWVWSVMGVQPPTQPAVATNTYGAGNSPPWTPFAETGY